MGGRIFKGSSVEECLKIASSEMDISHENLNYQVIEEKKGLFKKSVVISVEEPIKIAEDINGKVWVQDDKVMVKDPEDGGEPAFLCAGDGIHLIVNGAAINGRISVFEKDDISWFFDESESKRTLDIKTRENKLEALIEIHYIPLTKYKLKDSPEAKSLTLEKEVKEEVTPRCYTLQEIKEALAKLGIKFGIQEKELETYLNGNTGQTIVAAKGMPPIDDTDDSIIYKFQTGKDTIQFDESNYKNIDYRNVNLISSVKKGDIIAERKPGTVGKPGNDIFGNVIKKKDGKKRLLKIGTGCELKDENTVISSVDGRPNVKNNIIFVNEIYEVPGDVDIKSGNIKFIGDVKVHGSIMEGMKVEAGGSVEILKTVENSKVLANGNIVIQGNVIMSTVTAGGNDVVSLRRINDLEEFMRQIKSLMDTVAEIKKFNLLGYNKEDGEIIKVLLETKFKFMNKTCVSIIKDSLNDDSNNADSVIMLIREMLVGMAPLGIKNFGMLQNLIDAAKVKIEELKQHLAIPVNVSLSYCQDSTICSSGDIVITGKGQYVSSITAHNSIIFTSEKSVARGGELRAGTEVRCKTVGSTGGVATIVSVENEGHIWIDTAYQNTKLSVGGREYILDIPYRNLHAFKDNNGELIVEKLKL